ncbi:MAG: PKD domain-containing protein [Bacteroidetes bacterium]|jgi:hypothetical protein|nr:PKD domain-containing protein [Bacteroidota bacterium]
MKRNYFLLLTIILGLSACKKTPEPCFTHVQTGTSLEVAFTNCSIDATTYDWEFGDGGTSIAENPIYTFSTYGNHQVTLRATSKQGVSSTFSQTVNLRLPPNLVFTGSYFYTSFCDTSQSVSGTLLVSPVPGTSNRFYLDNTNTNYGEIGQDGTTIMIPRQNTTYPDLELEGEGTVALNGSSASITIRYYYLSSLNTTCYMTYTR